MKKLIIAIFLLFIMNNVNASTKDTNVKVEWIPNVYYNYEVNGTRYWGQFGYIYADNEIVYCTDINNTITTNQYSSSTSINMNSDVIQTIYFGYGYNDNNSLEDYMATQQLVWEYQGTDSYFTTESEGKGNIINIEAYKTKIKKLKNMYGVFPEFKQMFNFGLGSLNVIPDTNEVLSNFVLGNNTRNEISIENNNLIIKTTKSGEASFGIVTDYLSRGNNKVYYADSSQSLIKINSIQNKARVYKYMVHSGNIRINLYDNISKTTNVNGAGTLQGNIFKLYNSSNKLIGSYESLENGIITIYNLSIGNYVLEHSIVSEGYIKDKTIYNVEISINNINQEISIYLNPQVTTLNVTSTYGNPSIGTIYGNKDETYIIKNSNDEIVNKIITNDIGKASVNLLYDEYRVFKENSDEIDGYVISKNNFNEIHNYDIFIPQYETKLKVHLFEGGSTIPIKNVNFKLNNKNYITNSDGIIITDYLKSGKYLLEEDIPSGYYKIDNPLIEIGENSKYYIESEDIYIDIFIYNQKIKEIEVELISNGGKLDIDKVHILETDNYSILPIPIKDNNIFIGWYTKDEIKVTEETSYMDVLQNKLYAKYESIKIKNEENTEIKDEIIEILPVEESKNDFIKEEIETISKDEYDYRKILENEEIIDNEESLPIKVLPNLGVYTNKAFYLLLYLLERKNEEDTI